MPRKNHQNLTEKYEVKAWIPPQTLIDIAEERTSGMVMAFITEGQRWNAVSTLARSCYLQGLNDAIDSVKMVKPWEVEQ